VVGGGGGAIKGIEEILALKGVSSGDFDKMVMLKKWKEEEHG
jgi:hypothetical protein